MILEGSFDFTIQIDFCEDFQVECQKI